ncbi:Bidirectional amino acid transporter 1 [Theobroma cacao]|uniref:Bidirectional amino acid transporter 1 n=1 Tax=Theobroma cacao TaxID=3641 RepID=A0A061E5W5_THECC|nr:Bidirectional amino acid transporter 1 [Theobroma cacao]
MDTGIRLSADSVPYLPLREHDADVSDDARLKQLGYKQELSRSLSAIANFSVTFSIVSVITGLTTMYGTGLTFGGPVTMIYGWPIVGMLTLIVGLAMAEICSAYPTSGGLYYWSAKLSGKEWGPLASWFTGCEHWVGSFRFIDLSISAIFVIYAFCFQMVSGSEKMALPSQTVKNGGVLVDSGQSRLRELGYKQELKRDLSMFSNFAFSFSIISVLTGITTLYNTGLIFGGSVSLVYGWFIAGGFTMFVGLSMAEICSSYPTSGGLYYWSAKLAGQNWAPLASWLTGWFNIVGQWAVTASVDFSLAQLISVIILLSTGGKKVLSFFGQLAAAWNLIGVVLLMILIPSVSTERASAKFVFTHFNTNNGEGINSKVYIFVLGLLMSQYTLTGYDASAHMTEETKSADKNGPKGIISSIGISIIFGWGYLLGITFAVTNIPFLLSEDNDAGGYAIAEIFYLAFKNRYGNGVGGIICLGVVAIAIFFCGMSSVTSNSRMAYAFSRDGAMPLSSLWHKVNKQEVPINAVWLSAFISFCMALTSLGSLVAFQAMVSIATIGLYIAYALPIFFRVTLARKSFRPGPFNLGRFGILVGWLAVIWVATISVLFSLPVAYPITSETLNYTPVAVCGLLVLTVSSWIISARHWFTGPITNIDK